MGGAGADFNALERLAAAVQRAFPTIPLAETPPTLALPAASGGREVPKPATINAVSGQRLIMEKPRHKSVRGYCVAALATYVISQSTVTASL